MKAIINAPIVHRKLTVPINVSLRVTGLFYGVYGLAALVKLLQGDSSGHRSEATLFAAAILASFVIFGAVLALSIETFSVDPKTRRYAFRKGIWPFARTIEGPIKDIALVQVLRSESVVSDGESLHATTSATISARITWIDGRQPVSLFSGSEEAGLFRSRSGRERVLAKATALASALGCSTDDQSVV